MNQKNETTSTSFKKDATSRTLPISKREKGARPTKAHKKSFSILRRSPASVFFGLSSLEALSLLRNYSTRLLTDADRADLHRMEGDIMAELGDAAPMPF